MFEMEHMRNDVRPKFLRRLLKIKRQLLIGFYCTDNHCTAAATGTAATGTAAVRFGFVPAEPSHLARLPLRAPNHRGQSSHNPPMQPCNRPTNRMRRASAAAPTLTSDTQHTNRSRSELAEQCGSYNRRLLPRNFAAKQSQARLPWAFISL